MLLAERLSDNSLSGQSWMQHRLPNFLMKRSPRTLGIWLALSEHSGPERDFGRVTC